MDRIIRLYNPYIPSKPIALLKSHTTPIFFIHLCNEDNRIFTMSIDKCLNVWDVVDHSNLSSVRPKSHKINGELQYAFYNSKSKSFLINTDKVSFLSLKQKSNLHTEVVLSHKEPVISCLYNKQFKQLVSCTETGTVKIWDVESGKDVFEFSNAHGDQPVTCMTFDDTGRRLITGGRDGLCKIWNYNNGHCLRILRKENYQEIADIKYTRVYNNCFIISVGWDRQINIYDDDITDVRVFSDPITRWVDDIEHGHKEDILCLAKSESNFLATSGYDGEIIIWNMVSGHIFTKLHSRKPDNYEDSNLDGDLSVNKLIFLSKERYSDKSSAHLIASGPRGMIHFWSVFQGSDLLGLFSVNEKKGTNIVQMCTDSRYMNLYAADNNGYIYNWFIDGYALRKKETQPPILIKSWRGHTQNITAIQYIESAKVVISGAADCTIRIWSTDGKYIGTFGQDEIWNLYDSKTYKHPLVPYDVLIDENSLPDHPLFSTRETFQEVLQKAKAEEKETASSKLMTAAKTNFIDDDAIVAQIQNMGVPDKVGKRLRHEITKPMSVPAVDKSNKNYYQMLKCFDYDPKPQQYKNLNQFLTSKNK